MNPIEESDIEGIKQRIETAKKTRKEYEKKIERALKDKEALQIMKQMLPFAQEERKKEEEELLQQIKQLKSHKSKFQLPEVASGELQNEELESRLALLENLLADNVETIDRNQTLQDTLDYRISKSTQAEKELDSQIALYENYFKKLDRMQSKVPKYPPILLYLNDLENQIEFHKLQILNQKEKVKAQESEIERYHELNLVSQSKLDRKQIKLEEILHQTRINEFQMNRLKTEIADVNSGFARIQVEKDTEQTQFVIQQKNHKAEDDVVYSEVNLLRSRIASLETVINNFPEESKNEMNNQRTMVLKKKQLAHQIQKKINDILTEISSRHYHSPEVMQLSKNLEQHWKQHQALEDSTNKGEDHLHVLQDLLERKKIAKEELSKMIGNLEKRGKKIKSGMKSLDLLYETALIENRKFDAYNRRLTRDLEIYEAEQIQFSRQLKELSETK